VQLSTVRVELRAVLVCDVPGAFGVVTSLLAEAEEGCLRQAGTASTKPAASRVLAGWPHGVTPASMCLDKPPNARAS
jgi:hypothetical protein